MNKQLSIKAVVSTTCAIIVGVCLFLGLLVESLYVEKMQRVHAENYVLEVRGKLVDGAAELLVFSGVEESSRQINVTLALKKMGVVAVFDADGNTVLGSRAYGEYVEGVSQTRVIKSNSGSVLAIVPVKFDEYKTTVEIFEESTFNERRKWVNDGDSSIGVAVLEVDPTEFIGIEIGREYFFSGASVAIVLVVILSWVLYYYIGMPLIQFKSAISSEDMSALKYKDDRSRIFITEIESLVLAYKNQLSAAKMTRETLENAVKERTRELEDARVNARTLMLRATDDNDSEPRRIASEIHDNLCSIQVELKRKMEQSLKVLSSSVDHSAALDDLKPKVLDWMALTDEADSIARSIIGRYRNETIHYLGFKAALSDAMNVGCAGSQTISHSLCLVRTDRAERIGLRTQREILKIVQEAVRNVAKHTRATRVSVTADDEEGGDILFLISDNGGGFDRSKQSNSYGLEIMEERAAHIGANISFGRTKTGALVSLQVSLSNDVSGVESHNSSAVLETGL